MTEVPKPRKTTESGAELLARLNSRPDLKLIDSFIFGSDSSSTPSSSSNIPASSLPSGGKLIEITGPEGVGKTELALHCAAKACLPVKSKGIEVNGLASKVIYIDTNYKFSILRFAVILEKEIQNALTLFLRNSNSSLPDQTPHSSNLNSDNNATDIVVNNNEEIKPVELSDSDVEEIINESLKRFFVIKVCSSLQLVASLLSLEQSVCEDHTYSLLILDKASSFYWIDKAIDGESPAFKENMMASVSHALSRIVNHFGITCLALSSALFSNLRKKPTFCEEDGRGTVEDDGYKNVCFWRDYLGKSWSSLRTKKISLTVKEESGGKGLLNSEEIKGCKVISAFCSVSNATKYYFFRDDSLKTL